MTKNQITTIKYASIVVAILLLLIGVAQLILFLIKLGVFILIAGFLWIILSQCFSENTNDNSKQ